MNWYWMSIHSSLTSYMADNVCLPEDCGPALRRVLPILVPVVPGPNSSRQCDVTSGLLAGFMQRRDRRLRWRS